MPSEQNFAFLHGTPAPPSGFRNTFPQEGGTDPAYISNYYDNIGNVSARTTATESITIADQGKLVTFTNTNTISCTVDSTVPVNFVADILNNGPGTLQLAPSAGLEIAIGNAAPVSVGNVAVGTWGRLYRNETQWYFGFGSTGGGGGSTTFGLDLASVDSTHQKVVGFNGSPLDTTNTPTSSGQIWQWDNSAGKYTLVNDRPTWPVISVSGRPGAGQKWFFVAPASMTFPSNFSLPSSYGSCGVNPTSTAVFAVYKNGVTAGSISISTSGVFTFATSGGTSISLNAGDVLMTQAPGSQDATLADLGITLVAQRTEVLSPGTIIPILNDRGPYVIPTSDGDTFQPFDFVEFNGSTFLCRQVSTGNRPSSAVPAVDTTYWRVIAQRGTDGATTAAQVQNQSFVYCGAAGGTANAITLSPSPALASLPDGCALEFQASADNTGAVTVDASGFGATALKKPDGSALAAGDLKNGIIYRIVKNTSWWQLEGGGGGVKVQDVGGSVVIASASQISFPNRSVSNPSAGVAQIAGGMVLLEQHTASNSSTLDFTTFYSSDFDEYVFSFINLIPTVSGAYFGAQYSTNGGSSYASSGYNSNGNRELFWYSGGTGVSGVTNDFATMFLDSVSSDATHGGCSGVFRAFNLGGSSYKHWFAESVYYHSSISGMVAQHSMGAFGTTSVINAIRFIMNNASAQNGNISSGIIRCYGVCK